jgi:1,4-alpha-glucan branching enzyme
MSMRIRAKAFHQDWNTLIYNLGRNEVRGFLIASALEWLQHFHVDGLRVDAVASMLYRDYSRKAGEWVPNIHGGRENLEAVAFLKELNEAVAAALPRHADDRGRIDRVAGRHGAGERWRAGIFVQVEYGLDARYACSYMEHDPLYRRHHHHRHDVWPGVCVFGTFRAADLA